jgi:hypothetical protein
MGLIYAKASNPIIYLGLGNPNGKETQCLLTIRDGRKPAGVDTLFSICQKEWFARVWVFQELVFASNPWVQWGRAGAKWAAFLERGFSSYLKVSEKTLPRCSELGRSNTYTLRKLLWFSLYKQGGPSVCLIYEIWYMRTLNLPLMGMSLLLAILKLLHKSLPILQHRWRKGMVSSCC